MVFSHLKMTENTFCHKRGAQMDRDKNSVAGKILKMCKLSNITKMFGEKSASYVLLCITITL